MKQSFFLLATLLCAGCASKDAPPPPPAVTPPPASKEITLDWTPKKPRSLDPTQFTVHVFDAKGQPKAVDKAALSLAMPTMDMGKNDVALKATAPGVYVGTGRFTMEGSWWATVKVSTGGTVKTVAVPISAE